MPFKFNPLTSELDYYSAGDLVISTPANYDGGTASSVYGGAIIIDGGTA